MLQCPKCCGPVTVTHCSCHPESPPVTERRQQATQMYQNLGVAMAPAPGDQGNDQLLRRLEDVREGDKRIQEDLKSLQIRLLQNQLQHAQLQQEMLLRSRKLPPSPSPAAEASSSLTTCSLSPRPVTPLDSETVLQNSRLEMSQCGWYYGKLSWQQSQALLQFSEDGTFLVRDSQDPRFTYTLSLQRAKEGATSVRIFFSCGKFSLDADERIRHLMPRFSSVGALVSHYVGLDAAPDTAEAGAWDPGTKLRVRRPLLRSPPSLAHCARLAINKNIQRSRASGEHSFSTKYFCDTRQLPTKLLEYLEKYTLCI